MTKKTIDFCFVLFGGDFLLLEDKRQFCGVVKTIFGDFIYCRFKCNLNISIIEQINPSKYHFFYDQSDFCVFYMCFCDSLFVEQLIFLFNLLI